MLLRSHRQQLQQPPQQCLFICAITFLCLHVHGYTTTTTPTTTTTNTRTLSTKVPSCAFPCAERFLEAQFPLSACPDRSDATCFCKTHTHSGYTLGEGVLQCMLEFCPGSTVDEYGEGAYGVCDGVQGAVSKTHETLTATVVGSTGGGVVATGTETGTGTGTGTGISAMTGTKSTRTSPDTLTTSATSKVTTFQPPIPAATRTGTGTATTTSDNTDGTLSPSSSSSSNSSSSPSASTAPASDNDNGQDTHSLNAGSVVGVSVASGLSGFFLIAALLFLWRRKLKRRQQQKANYFEIGGHMSEPPDFGIPPRRPTPGPRLPPPPPTPTPPPKSAGRDAEPEMSRLMSPFEPRPQPRLQSESQSQSRPPNPAVVVTGVDGEVGYGYGYGYDSGVEDEDERLGPGAGRIGRAISSNFDQDSRDGYSTMTERDPSDLLPPKPESLELYPEPLRWDRQREEYSRPRSDVTTFEEEDIAQPRSLLGPNGYPNFSGLIGPRPYPGRPMAGLPAHPRAMMYGFTPQNHLPPKRAQGQPMKPVYTNPAPSVPSPYESGDRSSRCTQSQSQSQSSGSGSGSGSDDCDGGDYGLIKTQGLQQQQDWGQPSRGAGANRYYSPTMRPWHPRESLDTSDISDSGFETQRTSRHSGFFTPLSPVREVRTPTRVESPIDYSTSPAIRYPRVPGLGPGSASASGSRGGSKPSTPTPTPAATPDPAREIVSRPRIVRQHDIKRVEIRRGKRQSRSKQQRQQQQQQQQQHLPLPFQFRNLNAVPPYSPDDFWYDPGGRQSASQESSSGTSATGVASAPTPTIHRLSWGFGPPPVEKTITRKPMKRRSMGQSQGQGDGQHQLTPSRRGDDLILRVD